MATSLLTELGADYCIKECLRTFAKRWNAIPFEEKEAVAADMRRNLARIRNEAAKARPCERSPDKPLSSSPSA
ncbi:MAG TPA: hypothetical protein PKM57_04035 [Kiritimatiellia bacterium]|nr:hypothetical protein [Kiritimatiellia bacterium]HPS08130.1 hypothetical protein [Kiritimatiellia bacterium]